MTVSISQLILYSGALVILFLTPGPVWIAIIARTVSGGFKSGFALLLGVFLGDFLWPFIVFGGLAFITSIYADIFALLPYAAALILIFMGLQVASSNKNQLRVNEKLTKAGLSAGVSAGLLTVIANPKAALFYFTVLPSFFDMNKNTLVDLILISGVSSITPAIGNILIIYFLLKVRSFLSSTRAIRITNIIAGLSLISVGLLIAFFY
tara:strand:+ start:2702 stop:3325 length:624 start_codon:yes stop_codon:yes gene_type:complete